MRDEPDPPRKFYQLKPKEFEAVNPPSNLPPADSTPTTVRGHLRAANDGPLPPRPLPAPTENEVHALLRENHARADAAGLNEVQPVAPRRSRRKRDYWVLLLPINAFFGFMAFGPYRSAMTFTYGLSGMVIFTLGLTWVMWFVMDDY
ncbi:hypothetical protein [Horticoccus sp. 23ND18S-11]|uniref:hypothetical protein n=1 Tax=Horticoccus sp. 23ND18S-11 TaxID=3391832 RepID=UPI0039C97813